MTKIVIVGNTKSLKSLLLSNITGETLFSPTLGVEVILYGDYNIWDVSGRYEHRSRYYNQADIGIVVHGGEGPMTPQDWEDELKFYVSNITIHHVRGTIDEKLSTLSNILQ